MRHPFSLTACLLACWVAQAQVYQWKDSSGRTVISDTPPPATAKDRRTVAQQPADTSPTQQSLAEKEMAFKKRQKESREKAEKETKEQAAATERSEYCNRARAQLAGLESGAPVLSWDDQGNRRYLEEAGRQQEIERTRKALNETCR